MGKKIGDMLSMLSPAAGAVTGEGIGKILPYLSPGLGMMMGKGPFGGDHHGSGDSDEKSGYVNPGEKMFGMSGQEDAKKNPGFLSRFGGNLQELLFANAMRGFGGMGNY